MDQNLVQFLAGLDILRSALAARDLVYQAMMFFEPVGSDSLYIHARHDQQAFIIKMSLQEFCGSNEANHTP